MGFKSFRGAMRSVGLPIPKTVRGAMRQAGAPIPTIGAMLRGGRGSGHHTSQGGGDYPSDAWDPDYSAQCGACGWVVIPRCVGTHLGPYLCCGRCNAWMGPAPVQSPREGLPFESWVVITVVGSFAVILCMAMFFSVVLGRR